MTPEWADLVLAANIPNVELCVFVGYGFYVEADGGDGGDVLVQL